jgi:hypothetical protein
MAPVTRDTLPLLVDLVKRECSAAAALVLEEFEQRYPPTMVGSLCKLASTQFWLGTPGKGNTAPQPPPNGTAMGLMIKTGTLWGTPCTARNVPGLPSAITPPLNGPLLRSQFAAFSKAAHAAAKATYQAYPLPSSASAAAATGKSGNKTSPPDGYTAEFWRRLWGVSLNRAQCSEWFRFAELILTIVPGTVECERAFSSVGYLKSDHRNKLSGEHLRDTLRMFVQTAFTINTFPFTAALESWAKAKNYRWRDVGAPREQRKTAAKKARTEAPADGQPDVIVIN